MIITRDEFLFNKFVKTTTIDTLFYFGIYLYVFFLSPYLETLGWSNTLKGFFFSIFSVVGIFAGPVVGTISDKIGRFHMIMIGLVLEIIALLGYQLTANTTMLFVIRTVSAIGYFAVIISALSRVNDLVKDEERSKTTGVFHSVISIAIIVAPLIGGAIADARGYQMLLLTALISMLAILLGIILFDAFFYRDDHPHRKHDKLQRQDLNPFKDIKDVLKYKEFRAIAFVGICSNFSLPFTVLVLPYLVIDRFGLTNTHLSIALFLIGLAHVFQFSFGSFADHKGKGNGSLLGVLISGAGLIGMFFAPSYVVLLLFIFIKAIGGSLWNVSAWAYMSDIGEAHNIEGKIVGSYTSIVRIFAMVSSIISGMLLTGTGKGIFLIYGLIMLIPLPFVHKTMVTPIKKKKKAAHQAM